MVRSLTSHKEFLHSCHKTDPRVTDGGFDPVYTGPLQHCSGFILMAHKSKMDTGPMLRARAKGQLKKSALRRTDLVHSFQDLVKTMRNWAQEELKKRAD